MRFFRTFSIRYFDFLLAFMILGLNLIGIAAIGSAAPDLQVRQIEGMIMGIVIMLMVSLIDYNKLLRLYWVYYIVNILLLALVIAVGSTGGGAQRWIQIGGITFQPSEAAKILLILFYAKFIMKYKASIRPFVFFAICVLLVIPPAVLIYEEPDLSTTIMVMVIFASILFIEGVISYKLVIAVFVLAVPAVIVFINLVIQEGQTILDDYQQGRILAWLHPEQYSNSTAMQTMNSIIAIGSGMLTGKGYNTNEISSLLNSGYISQSQTDFIFAVIGEEFGFIGASAVVILIALISVRLFLIAREAKDTAGAVIASSMGVWIGFQGYMNIGVVTGVLPNTGIPLPFVSYGLTSLVSLYLGIGFALNVSAQNRNKQLRSQDS